jgi:hypothetical protein
VLQSGEARTLDRMGLAGMEVGQIRQTMRDGFH